MLDGPSKFPCIYNVIFSDRLSSSNSESSSDSHKNEGFLKSVWHKLTDHPAHSKDGTQETPSSSTETPAKGAKGDDKSKDDNEPKKASGIGH
jgi:molecular chaperone DnaJ